MIFLGIVDELLLHLLKRIKTVRFDLQNICMIVAPQRDPRSRELLAQTIVRILVSLVRLNP